MVNVMCELIFQVLRVILTSVSVLSNPLFRQIQGWIPAFAETHAMIQGWIPAFAETHAMIQGWIPASAGMTEGAGMTEARRE
jgi:hypothetical protein